MKRSLLIYALIALTARAEQFTVTAYCSCAKCCGKSGQPTASGTMPAAGVTVAGPRRLRLGTRVVIAGIGARVIQDRLARRYDNRIDLFMTNHLAALKFGIQKLEITILK